MVMLFREARFGGGLFYRHCRPLSGDILPDFVDRDTLGLIVYIETQVLSITRDYVVRAIPYLPLFSLEENL